MTFASDNRNAAGQSADVLSAQARRYLPFKRACDFAISAFVLLFAAIPMLFLCILIRIDSKGNPVFRQSRIGRHGKPFVCLKFRTMRKEAPGSCATGDLQDADSYITVLGRILRKTSLDELPQLINILKGDMSLIGPRPLIPEETEIHEGRMKAGVYALRPGLTGHAQINGRDLVTPSEKVRLDTEYLHNVSFKEDLRIVRQTFANVISAKDIHEGTIE